MMIILGSDRALPDWFLCCQVYSKYYIGIEGHLVSIIKIKFFIEVKSDEVCFITNHFIWINMEILSLASYIFVNTIGVSNKI